MNTSTPFRLTGTTCLPSTQRALRPTTSHPLRSVPAGSSQRQLSLGLGQVRAAGARAVVGLVAAAAMTTGAAQATVKPLAKRAAPTNPVTIENAKTDSVTTAWQIGSYNHAASGEIVGYASATSVNRGESVDIHVSVANPSQDPSYRIDLYRIGWYGGQGGRLIATSGVLPSTTQPACGKILTPTTINSLTTQVDNHTIECNWTPSHRITIPTSATDPTVGMSGAYLARLTTSRGLATFVPLVVRDDTRRADFMFQTSVTTYQAYNTYGGHSYYRPTIVAGQPVRVARIVSFNRPYDPTVGYGSGHFLNWEVHAVRFLEREGFDVAYSTNIDTHTNPQRLLDFRGFLSVGHDEYWTRSMYDGIEAARNGGVNLAVLSANTAYWQVRLEPDARGQANRRMVGYRYWAWSEDPQINTPNATLQWRQVGRPESALIGVQYDHDPVDGDLLITNCISWICKGTGVRNGSSLTGLWGYEADIVTSASPANIQIMARMPYSYTKDGVTHNMVGAMTYYTHEASGASVFATGSMQWNWGLDTYPNYSGRSLANPGAQIMMRNILNRFRTVPVR